MGILAKYVRETSAYEVYAKNNKPILNLVTISLFVTFTSICSQISIPLPFTPIPINLAMISVFMSGYILGSAKGALSQVVYILLGCIGVPVFANFHSGVGIIVGQTGGYIIGYIAASFIVGLFAKDNRHIAIIGLSMMFGLLACYFLGTMWFIILTKTKIFETLLICVIPFLLGDVLKIILSIFLLRRIKDMHSLK